MESGFRVLVEVGQNGRYWVFVDQNFNRVEDLKDHLKDLFSLHNPLLSIDGIHLPSKETIRIISPTDVLRVDDEGSDGSMKQKPDANKLKSKRLDTSCPEVFCYPPINGCEIEQPETSEDPANPVYQIEDLLPTKKKRKRNRKKNNPGAESSTNQNDFSPHPPLPSPQPHWKNETRSHIVFSDDGEPAVVSDGQSLCPVNTGGPSGDASYCPSNAKSVNVQKFTAKLSYPTHDGFHSTPLENGQPSPLSPVLSPQKTNTPSSSQLTVNGSPKEANTDFFKTLVDTAKSLPKEAKIRKRKRKAPCDLEKTSESEISIDESSVPKSPIIEATSTPKLPSTSVPEPAVDFRLHDKISFRVWKLDESYSPGISDVVTALVQGFDSQTKVVRVLVIDKLRELVTPKGKFSLDYCPDDEEEGTEEVIDPNISLKLEDLLELQVLNEA